MIKISERAVTMLFAFREEMELWQRRPYGPHETALTRTTPMDPNRPAKMTETVTEVVVTNEQVNNLLALYGMTAALAALEKNDGHEETRRDPNARTGNA